MNIDELKPKPRDEQLDHLRARIKQVESERDKLALSLGEQRELRDTIRSVVDAAEPFPRVEYKSGGKPERGVEAVLTLGDWHTLEVIKENQVEHINAYDWAIQQRRINYITDKFLKWLETMRSGYRIDRAHIFGMSDWVSGDIHEELLRTNSGPPPQQAVCAGRLLGEQSIKLASHVEELIFHPTGVDNHGRLSRKYQFKDAYQNSWNFVVYEVLKQYTSKVGNFQFNEPQGLQQFCTVAKHNFLLVHGHLLKGWMGIPFYAMQRSKGREAVKRMKADREQWRKQVDEQKKEFGVDYFVNGHFHVPCMPDYDALQNGALTGTNELDHGLGRYAPPAQCAFLVDSKHGWFNHCAFRGDKV